MLTLFRKHQRIIFISTATVVIASFTLFGMINPMGEPVKVKEDPLVRALDGSMITIQKMERMKEFLSSSQLDARDDRISFVNLLNDGVLEKDFLQTSLGLLLAEKIFPSLEKELQTIVQKASSFHPYQHSKAPLISAEAVWQQFSPESAQIARELVLHHLVVNPKTFECLVQGYLQQKRVPVAFIRKILAYQEGQFNVATEERDASLPYRDVSLLGLHSPADWLSESYLKAAAQVILNGAAYARTKGMKLSLQEVREDLMAHLKEGIESIASPESKQVDPYQVFLMQIRRMGLNEMECLDLWRDICLFRKLMKDTANAVEVDLSQFPHLQEEARLQAVIERFSLPISLQFVDFTSWMKLQVYLDAVSPLKARSSKDSPLATLPREFLPLAEIEKRAPELVQREFVLSYQELPLNKAVSQVPLKEVWAWQVQDIGWDFLKKKNATLASHQAKTQEERFTALETLETKVRLELDQLSAEHLLLSHPDRMKKLLSSSRMETKTVLVSSKGLELPFKGVKEPSAFVTLLEKSSLVGEKEASSPEASAAQEKLSFYTGDQEHYYAVSVVKRSPDKRVQTFAEANASGALRYRLDQKLELAYPEVRKKDSLSYLQKDGSWKPLAEVREKIGVVVFAPLCKQIAEEYRNFYQKEISKTQMDQPGFYAQQAMLVFMQNALKEKKEGTALDGSHAISPLAQQWELVQERETVRKSEGSLFTTSCAFEEDAWSSLLSQAPGKFSFFHVLQKLSAEPLTEEEIESVKAPFKKEQLKKFSLEFLKEVLEKKALILEGPSL